MSSTITRITAVAATLGAIGAMAIGTAPASASLELSFVNWPVSGTLKFVNPLAFGWTAAVPAGSAFNGTAAIQVGSPISGTVDANVTAPAFTSPGAPLPLIPPPLIGLTLTETAAISGTIAEVPATNCTPSTTPCLELNLPLKAAIGITTGIAAGCTMTPELKLKDYVTTGQFATLGGWHFVGRSNIPPVGPCVGGLLVDIELAGLNDLEYNLTI